MKRIKPFAISIVALVLGTLVVGTLLAGCAPGTETPPAVSLDGTSWTLLQLQGETPIDKTEITLAFAEGQVGGTAGCNRYFGAVTIDGGRLSIGPVGSTEMYCVDPEGVMDQETAFLKALESVASFRIENGELTLSDSAGQPVLTLTAAAE